MEKFGIAAMLIGFAVFYMSSPSKSYAYDGPPPESDSAILARHIHEVKVANSIEEFSDHSFNSHYSEAQLDSILWEDSRMRIMRGEVNWSPDSAFRVCTVEIESCGGYCNPEWFSWLHFNDGTGLVIQDAGFSNINPIDIMPDGKYLVIETSYGRSATYACRTDVARLFLLKDHLIIHQAFTDTDKDEVSDEPGKTMSVFSVGVCTNMITDCKLEYSAEAHELTYVHGEEVYLTETPDSVFVFTGTFNYVNGFFILKNSEQHKIKYVLE